MRDATDKRSNLIILIRLKYFYNHHCMLNLYFWQIEMRYLLMTLAYKNEDIFP